MLAIAVLCSWVGALCWNIASQRLPTVILGPLIVFETRRTAVYLPAAAKLTAAADPERHPAAGARRGLRRTRQTGKPMPQPLADEKVASPP